MCTQSWRESVLARRAAQAARTACKAFGNASGCGQAVAEEPLRVVLSPPEVTKQGAEVDAAPQRCCEGSAAESHSS